MDEIEAVAGLTALSHTTRIRAFRRLVTAHPEGLAAGEIARHCDTPHNTMSTHLAILARAGLASPQRQGRSVVYRAELERLRAVVLFLTRDCCRGHAEVCAPLVADLACCTPAVATEKEHA
jgi:ArsR family transcriptional regulator, arsenate/arsenite/antimonite-responsive transcriptional repressor